MFSKGIFIPILFIKSFIAGAADWGLAVNINISPVPNLPAFFSNTLKKGPFLPLITFSNSLKSNFAPYFANCPCLLANSIAVNFPFAGIAPHPTTAGLNLPSGKNLGISYLTMLFVVATVWSKSKTLIPFKSLDCFFSLPFIIAWSVILFLIIFSIFLT